MLSELSASRATQGFSPRETAMFVFSLKQPLFDAFQRHASADLQATADANWSIGLLLDQLGLFTTEAYQKARETLIVRQQQEMLGAVDAGRPAVGRHPRAAADRHARQRAHAGGDGEPAAERSSQTGAEIAIIDITGVPTVDTLVAQHLLKTVAAARLMGADCIISGIRPQIAQTIVHLGVELDGGHPRPRWPTPSRWRWRDQARTVTSGAPKRRPEPDAMDRIPILKIGDVPARHDPGRHARPAGHARCRKTSPRASVAARAGAC